MQITIYCGTNEIGGTLTEVQTGTTRILTEAGHPSLFKNALTPSDHLESAPH